VSREECFVDIWVFDIDFDANNRSILLCDEYVIRYYRVYLVCRAVCINYLTVP